MGEGMTPRPSAGCGKSARPVRRAATGNGARARIEAPACGESRRQQRLPGTYGYRASRRLYPGGSAGGNRWGSRGSRSAVGRAKPMAGPSDAETRPRRSELTTKRTRLECAWRHPAIAARGGALRARRSGVLWGLSDAVRGRWATPSHPESCAAPGRTTPARGSSRRRRSRPGAH